MKKYILGLIILVVMASSQSQSRIDSVHILLEVKKELLLKYVDELDDFAQDFIDISQDEDSDVFTIYADYLYYF